MNVTFIRDFVAETEVAKLASTDVAEQKLLESRIDWVKGFVRDYVKAELALDISERHADLIVEGDLEDAVIQLVHDSPEVWERALTMLEQRTDLELNSIQELLTAGVIGDYKGFTGKDRDKAAKKEGLPRGTKYFADALNYVCAAFPEYADQLIAELQAKLGDSRREYKPIDLD